LSAGASSIGVCVARRVESLESVRNSSNQSPRGESGVTTFTFARLGVFPCCPPPRPETPHTYLLDFTPSGLDRETDLLRQRALSARFERYRGEHERVVAHRAIGSVLRRRSAVGGWLRGQSSGGASVSNPNAPARPLSRHHRLLFPPQGFGPSRLSLRLATFEAGPNFEHRSRRTLSVGACGIVEQQSTGPREAVA